MKKQIISSVLITLLLVFNITNVTAAETYGKLGDTTTGNNQWVEYRWNGSGYEKKTFRATLTTTPEIKANVQANNTSSSLKSGYGYFLDLKTNVNTNEGVDAAQGLASAQNVNVVFPEFNYKNGVTFKDGTSGKFNRLMQVMKNEASGTIANTELQFKENTFAASVTPKNRVHFTPLWYPNANYQIYMDIFDAWTPAGMLSATSKPQIGVNGNVYEDWHIGPK